MATTITAPLEVQLGEIPGVQQMTSSSSAGASIITMQFDLSLDLDIAEQHVQEAINAANSLLPGRSAGAADLCKGQSGRPADPYLGGDFQVDVADGIAGRNQQSPGCEDFRSPGRGPGHAAGGNVPAVRVEADPKKLAAYGLNIDDLRSLIGNVNMSQPKGNFDGPKLDYTINGNDQI